MLDDLKEWLSRDPFTSFRIILTSGTTYDVTTPYQIAIGKTQLDYYFPRSDKKAVIRQNQIAAFETVDGAKA